MGEAGVKSSMLGNVSAEMTSVPFWWSGCLAVCAVHGRPQRPLLSFYEGSLAAPLLFLSSNRGFTSGFSSCVL